MLRTERADHLPPRAVAISRRLSSPAIALALVAPPALMLSIVNARPFALSSAPAFKAATASFCQRPAL
jgi:hypothetical protein